jgi:hypothetical protein
VYHDAVLTLLLPVLFAAAVEVERVLALVNNVPVLASDVELAEVGALVPREPAESDADYARAVLDALVDLELRWQDLQAAGITTRAQVDLDAAWRATMERAGGEEALREKLAQIGFNEGPLRELVRRAAVVQSYVASRFGPFVRPTSQEVETFWQQELIPQLKSEGKPVPPLADVRPKVEALLRERKLAAEIDRWTAELAKRAEVVRYLAPPAASSSR